METLKTIDMVRTAIGKARSEGKRIGLVPTMGALHEGHISLINAAMIKCDFVVVSIFVNPTQFAPNEDLDRYPRDLENDLNICDMAGVDLVFAPADNEMYPEENLTWVEVEELTENLCGKSRPGHFRGVTTVCMKLFNIVCPDVVFFGQKDAQQAAIIKRMVKDMNLALEMVICPTVREKSGLAVSSRNKYLTEEERKEASLLYESLAKCEKMVSDGERGSKKLINAMREVIDKSSKIEIEYISITDAETLLDVEIIEQNVLVALAAKIGNTRLIDNMPIDLNI